MHSSSVFPVYRIFGMCLSAAAILLFLPSNMFAQTCGGRGITVQSSGTKFLLVFMQNESPSVDAGNSTRYQDIYLASDADTADTVTISCRAFPNWIKTIPLKARGSAVYRLSTDPIIGFPNQDAIVESEESIDSTVFKVVSKYPIACYGMNNKAQTADAFLALPSNAATTDYVVMSYFNSTQNEPTDELMPSEFAVASFEDNNSVTIIPSAVTRHGNPAGAPMTFVLDSGECVQIQTPPDVLLLDLTGSIVRAQKPVVVYGGHARTEAETGYLDPTTQGTSRDHLCEAIPPMSTWGRSFIAKNFGRPQGDILRVLTYTPNTRVKINGIPWGKKLKAFEFRDTNIRKSDTAELNIFAVESDQPILVGMIAHTADQKQNIPSGDPDLDIVPPLEQTYNDLTYFISEDTINYDVNTQFVIIVTEKSGVGLLSVDGVVIPDSLFTNVSIPLEGKNWAATTLHQRPGIHRIITPNIKENGVTILAYGFGDVISYGYTAGSLLDPLHGIMALPSPTPGISPGQDGTPPNTTPSIIVRNIMAEKIYFDSARVSYDLNREHINVRLKKDISLETGTINTAEEKTLELVTSQPVKEQITGSIRIWYHSALWNTLLPVDFPFTIVPQSEADVNVSSEQTVVLENFPNPASGRTTVHFAIPSRASASIKIYDALGRVVRTLRQGMVNSGDQSIQINTKELIPGDYTLELLVPELGINEHRKMIVIE